MDTYKSVIVTRRGGSDALQVVRNELRQPGTGEARIRILATPVCQDDVAVRVGNRPFLPKTPFTPGYAMIGEVDALGAGVNRVREGDRVAALTQFGGYAEYIYLPENQLAQVPRSLDPCDAAPLILNYLVAYQIMHRVAKVKPGDKALLIGSSGGVGTAFLQLGRLAGIKMYGLASPRKHALLAEYGAEPIDYHRQDFVEVLRRAEPGGIDFVFNGMGEEYFERGLAVLRRGGSLVHYGGPQSLTSFGLLILKFGLYNLLPNGKSVKGYGTHRGEADQFLEDWTTLFRLLAEGQIQPVIQARFPLTQARQANELLESGQVTGNLVLVAHERMQS